MEWTADEIRQLRYRMGWSQAEMARRLKLELASLSFVESGTSATDGAPPPVELTVQVRNELARLYYQAEDINSQTHRRPIAEVMMKDLGLSQIHAHEVDGLEATPALQPSRNNPA